MGLFSLVDLDMLLHATHHRTSQVFQADRVLSDFAKCDHRVLIVIAVEGQRSTRGDFAGTLRREQDQLEPIRNFENTIFDGNTRHCETLHWARESVYIWSQSADGNSKRRRAGAPESLRLTLVGAGAYMAPLRRPDGRVGVQRTANPRTAVRFRFRPPAPKPLKFNPFSAIRVPRRGHLVGAR